MFNTYILGNDGCLWKINLEILWNNTMKNCQVKHGQCGRIIFPETFSFGSSKYLLDLSFCDKRILLTDPEIYPQKYRRTLCPAELICKGSNKQQRRGGIILNFTKRETFFISYNSQVLFKVISRCHPPSCTLWKRSSSPLQSTQEENVSGHSFERRAYLFVLLIWKKSLLICFESYQGVPYFYRQSRKRMTNTFIMVNITLICKRWFSG